jgi:hypothetical protein
MRTVGTVVRKCIVTMASAVALGLAGCGTSDEEEVARVLETYPHALAAGNAQAACDAFSPRAQLEQSRAGFCASLRESASEMTPAERRRLAAAEAVHVKVEGDRATGYLRFGDCTFIPSGSELTRSDDGQWQIDRMGGPANHEQKRCFGE